MPLPKSQDLGFGITCIDTGLHQRSGAGACYLICEGDTAALVDTGTYHSVPGLLAVLKQRGVARERVRYVCPTHVHTDHGGGAGELMRHLPNATLVAHPRAAPHFIDPSKIRAGSVAVYGEVRFKAIFGEIVPVPAERVRVAEDGFWLDLNGRRLEFLDSPGHARHHYCVWDAQSRGFFAGDTFGLSYREFDTARGAWILPTTTPVQFEPDAWNQTLDRLLSYQPARMYLTHWGMVEELPRLAGDLRRALAEYSDLARRYAESTTRHDKLKQGLTAMALRGIAAHVCTLPEALCRELLEVDMDLNAQGLGVWLDRLKAKPHK